MMNYKGIEKRIVCAMPPRHSKSSMITIAYPLWLIFRNPNLHILIVNNSATLSEKFGISLREYVKQYGPKYNVYLSDVKHSNSSMMFEDRKGKLYNGSIKLVGAGGSITGEDVDYLIIDDPYKGLADEFTPSALQKKIDWFKTVILQRLEPETRLLILHTRWNSNDLIGYLKENQPNDYIFIEYKAILNDGTPLWKERYSIELLNKRREEIGERMFQALYQQEPMDTTSDFFNLNDIYWNCKQVEELTPEICARGWDIASSDTSKGNINDSTAGVKGYITDDGYFVVTDLVHGQFGTQTKDKIVNTAVRDGVNYAQIIETGIAAAGKLLFQEWEEQLKGYRVIQAKPIKSKVDRSTPLQNAILDCKVIVNIYDDEKRQEFIDEFETFPNGGHDDIVDATAHLYNYLVENKVRDEPVLELLQL